MNTITTINPATGEEIKNFNLHTINEVDHKIELAQKAFQKFRLKGPESRKEKMLRLAELLEEKKQELAEYATLEMGKLYNSSLSEVEKCAWVCRYYAEHAADHLSDQHIETEAQKSYISYRPLGVLLAVMPWNYPYWQVFRFAAPAIMAGNTAVLKHASNVPQCAMAIQDVILEAGFEKGTLETLLIKSDQVEHVIAHKYIRAVTLTGSGPAGSAVASLAAKHFKKAVLELGGSDPYLILKDANIKHAAQQCVESRLLNAGQSCIGAKRFIVVEDIYNEFLVEFVKLMRESSVGNPMDNYDLGPMARIDLRDEVHQQVIDSVEAGAELILGGTIPDSEGAYYPPTVLVNVERGMPAYSEEIFGPVASVIKAKDEADAIRIANDTDFGLGACVFTEDIERGEYIASHYLEAGCCFVNQYVKSDPRLPFGGIKSSGFGRELSANGIREFVNIKTVYVK